MSGTTEHKLRSWAKSLPYSQMVYPASLNHKLKYYIWRMYTPYHPYVRDTLTNLHVVRQWKQAKIKERQDYLIGTIAPEISIEDFVSFLLEQGFANHFVAWKDEGEVVSLRYVENFMYQYHLRVFADKEVRAHYEYTPECYPLSHFNKIGQEERREYFLTLLGARIIPAR